MSLPLWLMIPVGLAGGLLLADVYRAWGAGTLQAFDAVRVAIGLWLVLAVLVAIIR